MKLITAFILLCAATTASANPFPDGKEVDGQKLFIKYDCNQCHNKIMHGDGNVVQPADRILAHILTLQFDGR